LKLLILFILSFVFSFFFPQLVLAKIPYSDLEKLRQKTVVLQVALDKLGTSKIKSCEEKVNADELSDKLAMLHDQAATEWKKTYLTAQDVNHLMIKAKNCSPRASCLVYETFVNSAKTTKPATRKIDALKQMIDQQVKTMATDSYQKAWTTVRNPCLILSALNP
jgi:hypothetical protein